MLLSKSLSNLKKVISSTKFKRDFRKGVIFSMSFLTLFVFFKVQPSFAIEKLELEKKKKWFTRSYMSLGMLSGIGVVGITSYTIYSLYNDNSLLKASLKIAKTSLNIANSRIGDLEFSISLFDYASTCQKCICDYV
jgi:hypothetical protein